MLDVHPEPLPKRLCLVRDRRAIRGEEVSLTDSDTTQRVIRARALMDRVIASGHLVPERFIVFEFVYHFDTVADLAAYAVERWPYVTIDAALRARLARAVERDGAMIRVGESVRALRLRPSKR
ncbi:MAG: hypothetical protein EPO26_09885 [Chloroflexota bacterium]|nr:MAG: hypothetical protein EPO26_09885 [Chloroflexota bacterium]